MGLFSWLFGKSKEKETKKYNFEDADGQEQFFRDDFDEQQKQPRKKSESKPAKAVSGTAAVKKSAPEKSEQKAEANATHEKAVETPKIEDKKAKVTEAKTKKPAETPKAKAQKPADATKAKPAEKEAASESPAPTPKEIKGGKSGKFEIKKAKDGRFVFNLYAPNHIIVATSQVYSSSSAAVNGIQSIIANAERAAIEDNTLKNPAKQPYPKWEMYIDKAGEYRFRLYATNGNCVVHSQGYKQKSSCKNGIDSIIRCSRNAEIDKSYLKKE